MRGERAEGERIRVGVGEVEGGAVIEGEGERE